VARSEQLILFSIFEGRLASSLANSRSVTFPQACYYQAPLASCMIEDPTLGVRCDWRLEHISLRLNSK
jgi:hypothetical protein